MAEIRIRDGNPKISLTFIEDTNNPGSSRPLGDVGRVNKVDWDKTKQAIKAHGNGLDITLVPKEH